MVFTVPAQLRSRCAEKPELEAWLTRLPGIVADLERRWSLAVGEPLSGDEGSNSWVAPVTVASGMPAILKIGIPHMESRDEIEGLRVWNGDPMVHLLDADHLLSALLLERCEPGSSLRSEPEPAQDQIIASILQRAWRAHVSPDVFRPLADLTTHWSNQTLAAAKLWPDSGLVRAGLQLFHELPRSATESALLVTDLHAGNVLRAQRAPWLAIDPKPFVGDPAYDATQHLFNCQARLRADPRGTIGHLGDLLGVDAERVRLWTFARAAAEPRDDWQTSPFFELARSLAASR